MAGPLEVRAAGALRLSTVALVGIVMGVVIVGLFIALLVLLIRARQTQNKWEQDMEERGIAIINSQAQDSSGKGVTKPRAVLRRNTILPFNNKSGWGTLPSVETINPPEPPSIPPHYVPPTPTGRSSKSSRLSWPFSARRASGRAIQMKKIRVPILSTVIESPKPSPLVPVLSVVLGDQPSPKKSVHGRPSSDQSLLQHHPAFRNTWQDGDSKTHLLEKDESAQKDSIAKAPEPTPRVLPNRSKSVAEIPIATKNGTRYGVLPRLPRPKLHSRSASMCSQASGTAPDAPVPPLPLEVARIKTQERRKSLLSRSPSRFSISSFESAGSSILATQSSPILSNTNNMRVQKVTKRDWRNSMIVGPRPLRDNMAMHGKNPRSQSSIKSSAARISMGTPTTTAQTRAESRSSTVTQSSSMQSIKLKTADVVTLSKVSSPTNSPLTVRSYTPKRKSGSHVTAFGSPEERPKAPIEVREYSGNTGGPMRQLSRASTLASSTRSSNGNPFQWDPPSALKGSPSARKGHRRKKSVRISLDPTIHVCGPPSRTPSPSGMNDIQEESPNATTEKRSSVGLGFSNTRSLPRPPSTSVFAPDVKFTSLRASLTPSSPTLSMFNYDQGTMSTIANGPILASNRMSTGSVFTIPTFPSPCHDTVFPDPTATPPPTFALQRPSNEYDIEERNTELSMEPSSPFEIILPDINIQPMPAQPLPDGYDPERPGLVFETPIQNTNVRSFSSPFSTIPEEPSPQSVVEDDSPPCSPKTMRPNLHLPPPQSSFPQYSIQHSVIPEESPVDTIDPAILSQDAFSMLNSTYNPRTSIVQTFYDDRDSMSMPASPADARSMIAPLLEAAFPSSPPCTTDAQAGHEQPLPSPQSSPSSIYTSPSPSSSPMPPCSPRPAHAQLPTPALNFAEMPMLSPNLTGPRDLKGPRESPGQPLRTSIAKLRRLNSDAKQESQSRAGRGERRYLRLGREDSIALPGDESYLDELETELDEDTTESTFDEAKGRQLVGDLPLDWEEEATMLELDGSGTATPTAPTPTQQSALSKHSGSVHFDFEQGLGLIPSTPRSEKTASEAAIRSSSIWEDGEKFWHSTPPPPPQQQRPHTTIGSPNKPRNNFLPLSSSPLATPMSNSGSGSTRPRSNTKITNRSDVSSNATATTTTPTRKRDFEVAKDDENLSSTKYQHTPNASPTGRKFAGASSRYRRRSALGNGTPNVRIQVQGPSSPSGTPGSLFDAQGFYVGP